MIGEKPLLISIVIPVKNGGPWLEKTLSAIFAQTLIGETEVIVIDSGSTDNTMDILSKFPVRIICIEPGEFNHGETRNLGVRQAQGKYIVMTVQDAVPYDEHWLQQLISGFDDENVAGVCGLQTVPHELDKNPVAWFRPVTEAGIRKYSFPDIESFNRLTPEEKREVCGWDDVNAMYRKDILQSIPFRKVAFAEDIVWAVDAIKRGYSIVYNAKARINHYHYETPDYAFRRSFTEYYHFYKLFGLKPTYNSNELLEALKNTKLLLKEESISWKAKWRWLLFNYKYRQAIKRSANVFNTALAKSERDLDILHENICSAIPQALNVGVQL